MFYTINSIFCINFRKFCNYRTNSKGKLILHLHKFANVIVNSFQYTATNISINVSIEEPILSPGTLKLLSIKRHLEKAKKVTPPKPKFPNAQDKVDSKYYKILNIVKTKPGRANGINPLKFPPK